MLSINPHKYAEELLGYLGPACERLEIAGSLRRGYRKIHDLDLVAIPKAEDRRASDLFGEFGPPVEVDLLDEAVNLIDKNLGTWKKITRGSGPKIKKIEHIETGFVAEVFVANPWNFGVLLAVRTGPHELATKLMEIALFRARQVSGGFYLHDHKAERRDGEIKPCIFGASCKDILKIAEEADFFDALGLDIQNFPPTNRRRRQIIDEAAKIWPLDRLGPKERNEERRKLP